MAVVKEPKTARSRIIMSEVASFPTGEAVAKSLSEEIDTGLDAYKHPHSFMTLASVEVERSWLAKAPKPELPDEPKEEITRYEVPDFTCESINEVQTTLKKAAQQLEGLRHDNDMLRNAASSYKRDNKMYVEKMAEVNNRCAQLLVQNEQLKIRREWIEGLAMSSVLNQDQLKLVELQLQADALVGVEDILLDMSRVIEGSYQMKQKLSANTQRWLKKSKSERVAEQQRKREVVLAKLTDAEIELLGIKKKIDNDDDEEDE